jgi:hypothetical protein
VLGYVCGEVAAFGVVFVDVETHVRRTEESDSRCFVIFWLVGNLDV